MSSTNGSRRSETEDLIEMRRAYAKAATATERARISTEFEARNGITDMNDRRHAAWYASTRRKGWTPPVTRMPTEDELHERSLEIAIEVYKNILGDQA
jgi:hypothetical protein